MIINSRYLTIIIIISLLFCGLLSRLIFLQIFKEDFLKAQGKVRNNRTQTISGYRGMILDRNGSPLAVSTPVYSIWANPQYLPSNDTYLKFLSELLNLSPQWLKNRINNYKNKQFIYLKRHLAPEIAEVVNNSNIPGIHIKREYKRFYPEGETFSQILGFTNIDDVGQEGLELAFDKVLRGKDLQRKFIVDLQGRNITHIKGNNQCTLGKNIKLSLDRRLQYLAYRTLQDSVKLHKAEFGSVVVLDVETGEILATTNYPSFNPNNRTRFVKDAIRNRAITDSYEFGSVMKTFGMISVLESENLPLDTKIDTSPGVMHLPGGTVRDWTNLGTLSLSQILARSSNIGISKLVLRNPPHKLIDLYLRLGFAQTTGSKFPGENIGSILEPHKNSKFELATMSFGYGISANTLQLAKAYATIGSKGISRDVSFIKLDSLPAGKNVLNPKVAEQTLQLLTDVVERGSGKLAKVPGYNIAGKTGTARILNADGYDPNRHLAIFAGLVPASKPKFSIVVLISEPKGKYYSGVVAAPIFATLATEALQLYNVMPS